MSAMSQHTQLGRAMPVTVGFSQVPAELRAGQGEGKKAVTVVQCGRIWRRGDGNLWERQQQRRRGCVVEESR